MDRNSEDSSCYGNVRALAQRDFLLRWARRSLFLLFACALLFAGFQAYGVVRKHHLAKQTRQFFERGDYKSAVLVARRLLTLDSKNLAACRVMAETAELAGRAEAVAWRRQIAVLEPNDVENQLAFAASALRFGERNLAGHLLKTLPAPARNSFKYHQLAGALAVAGKNPTAAGTHFAAALELQPENLQTALNLASVQLSSKNSATVERARVVLVRLTEEQSIRREALRALAADALANQDQSNSRKWATLLTSESGATVADVLLFIQAMKGTDAAAAALEDLKSKAAPSPATVGGLITWMNRQGMAKAAAEWGSSLPKTTVETQPVPLAIAESYSYLQDWNALKDWVAEKDWGAYESFRLAVKSHALHRLNHGDRASMETQTIWRAALKTAQARPEQLAAIAQLAEGWGYASDAEEAWWMIANNNDSAKPALEALHRLYKSKQDSRGLLRVAKRALELNPGDLVAANNCASLGLLLSGDGGSRRLAAKLHTEHPANAAFTATYAFALHTEGRTSEGLKVFEHLKEEQLRHPAIAAYYFVMLVEDGNMQRAQLFLPAAKQAYLLPEEQALLSAASRKLL